MQLLDYKGVIFVGKKYSCSHLKYNKWDLRVSPMESGIRSFSRLVRFFMYETPGRNCSVHSQTELSRSKQEQIAKKMLKELKDYRFLQKIQAASWKNMSLDEDNLCFQCPRMICEINDGESELNCLLRHLRNAFAHCNLSVKRTNNQTYILLEDFKGKKCTARIVVTNAILNRWKTDIEEVLE